jgi:hypothetical protein
MNAGEIPKDGSGLPPGGKRGTIRVIKRSAIKVRAVTARRSLYIPVLACVSLAVVVVLFLCWNPVQTDDFSYRKTFRRSDWRRAPSILGFSGQLKLGWFLRR